MKIISLLLCSLLFACASFRCGNESYKREAYSSVVMLHTQWSVKDKKGTSTVSMAATGFAVDDRHIVTAGHFCNGMFEFTIKNISKIKGLDFQFYEVGKDEKIYAQNSLRIIGVDDKNDLCMIESKEKTTLKPVKLSNKKVLKIRDKVFIVGAPAFSFPIEAEGVVSLPVIESKNEDLNGKLLLSLPIYRGNSGSPVFDSDGEVIGVIVMGDNNYEHIAIATSIVELREFVNKILKK